MRHLKKLTILCLISCFVSCSSEIPYYSFYSKVNVLLVNKSNNPCYMWMGHNPLPPANPIPIGAHADTALIMKINVYDVTDESNDNTTYQEDRLDYELQVNIGYESDTIQQTKTVVIHEIYSKSYRLKFYWDGRNLTCKYAL